MKVKEAQRLIENIDNEIKNLQKLRMLSKEYRREIEEKANLNNTLDNVIDTSANIMIEYRNMLEEKIAETEIE